MPVTQLLLFSISYWYLTICLQSNGKVLEELNMLVLHTHQNSHWIKKGSFSSFISRTELASSIGKCIKCWLKGSVVKGLSTPAWRPECESSGPMWKWAVASTFQGLLWLDVKRIEEHLWKFSICSEGTSKQRNQFQTRQKVETDTNIILWPSHMYCSTCVPTLSHTYMSTKHVTQTCKWRLHSFPNFPHLNNHTKNCINCNTVWSASQM